MRNVLIILQTMIPTLKYDLMLGRIAQPLTLTELKLLLIAEVYL